MKISVLSNININGVFFKKQIKQRSDILLHLEDGFASWQQSLLNPREHILDSELIFIYIDSIYFFESDKIDSNTIDSLLDIIVNFKNKYSKEIVVSLLDYNVFPIFTAKITKSKIIDLCNHWNSFIIENNIPCINIPFINANYGIRTLYSPIVWYASGIPFSKFGEETLAREIIKISESFYKSPKKCIVLDLDNTLWGGVIGEDGIDNIEVGSLKNGLIYRDFQRVLKILKNNGIILTICSKNNIEDALLGLSHKNMILNKNDFAIIKANWKEKTENIIEIAKELNIGLNSIVFIDDSYIEREKVKINLPEVVVPDFPKKIYGLKEFIVEIGNSFFYKWVTTKEDLYKTNQYLEQKQRNINREKFKDIIDYYRILSTTVKVSVNKSSNIERVAQMALKTNQYNTTLKRYTKNDLLHIMHNKGYIFDFDISDKYGNLGICVVVICFIIDSCLIIDNFIMSCRVMNRDIEKSVMCWISSFFIEKGIKSIRASYIENDKNKPCKGLWSECTLVKDSECNYVGELENIYNKFKSIDYIKYE